jgi:hypothetical protein
MNALYRPHRLKGDCHVEKSIEEDTYWSAGYDFGPDGVF